MKQCILCLSPVPPFHPFGEGVSSSFLDLTQGTEDETTTPRRYDCSLGLLTKKFVGLVQQAENGILDLNAAAEHLGVQKRRIYDITNVLEGIGLIEKKSKNNIQWKGSGDVGDPDSSEVERLQELISQLDEQTSRVDGYISKLNTDLEAQQVDPAFRQGAYVTDDDIRSIPTFRDKTLIAIKAPSGTTLAVPYANKEDDHSPASRRKFQIFLKSENGPVDIYLVSNHEEEMQDDDAAEVPNPPVRVFTNRGLVRLQTCPVDRAYLAPCASLKRASALADV